MKVLLFINKGEKNPFVANLFNSLQCNDKIEIAQSDLLEIEFLKGFDIIHIHWPEVLHNWLKLTETKLQEIIKIFDELKSVKIVYTKHNFKSHQLNNRESEYLYHYIEGRADKIIHLTDFSYQLNKSKGEVIPHGSFGYQNLINQQKAREILGFKADDFVILSFGKIRNYQEQLVIYKFFKAFNKINIKTKILVPQWTGASKPSYKDSVFKRVRYEFWNFFVTKKMNLKTKGFVLNNEIQIYFNACNIVFIPRKNALNSGVFYLAQEFKKQVIGVKCDFPGKIIESYNQLTIDFNADINRQLIKEFKLIEEVSYPDFITWNEIAEMHYKVYEKLLNDK